MQDFPIFAAPSGNSTRQRVEFGVAAQEIEAGALQCPANQLAVSFGIIPARIGRVEYRRRDPRGGIRPLVPGFGQPVKRVGVREGQPYAAQRLLPSAERGVIAGELSVDISDAAVVKQEISVTDYGVPDLQRRLLRKDVVLGRDVLPPKRQCLVTSAFSRPSSVV